MLSCSKLHRFYQLQISSTINTFTNTVHYKKTSYFFFGSVLLSVNNQRRRKYLQIKFNTVNEDMKPIVNFKPSASFGRIESPWRAREDCSHVPMHSKYGNTFSDQIHPWLQPPESAIASPDLHNPIPTNSSYNFPRDQNLPVQPPFSAATGLPLLPQREFHPIPQNPTSFPTETNSFGNSSGSFHDKNTTFQGSFDRSQVSYQASDGIYKQQIAYGNMQPYGIDCQLSRRNQRINMRRESRSKERLPYQIPEKKRVSKYKTKKYNSIVQACLLLTNSEEETKTQSSLAEMKLLVLKQLQNSDVGTLGRVVLPKKAVEAELPPLQMKEGIDILAKDFENNCQWLFKFRFWPNNKSRMYILENTGHFIQRHGLKKGDYLMLYGAEGRYMIRGMKATESEQSNSSACTSEAKLQSSEGGDEKIVSQAMENANMDEMRQRVSAIKEEDEKMKMKMMMDDEPQLPLDTSCTHFEEKNILVSKGIENTLSISEITPEINESIMVSQGMGNIDMISNEDILAITEADIDYGLDFLGNLQSSDFGPNLSHFIPEQLFMLQ